MTPGWSPIIVACWLAGTGAGPQSYLGVHAEVPQFAPEDYGFQDDGFGGAPALAGLQVTSVVENSPAEQAGVQVGDVIVELNGTPVRSPAHLDGLVGSLPVGATCAVEVRRGDRLLELETRTVARLVPLPEPDVRGWLDRRHFGIVVEDVSSPVSVAGSTRSSRAAGARVRQFLPGSVAPDAGLEKGDVLARLNGETIRGGEDLLVLLRDLEPGDEVEFAVRRDGEDLSISAETRHPGSYVTTFFLPPLVDYERDRAKDSVEFAMLLYLFMYEREEDRSTWRFLWFIEFGTGSEDDLEVLE